MPSRRLTNGARTLEVTIGLGAAPRRRLPLRTVCAPFSVPYIHTNQYTVNTGELRFTELLHILGAPPIDKVRNC